MWQCRITAKWQGQLGCYTAISGKLCYFYVQTLSSLVRHHSTGDSLNALIYIWDAKWTEVHVQWKEVLKIAQHRGWISSAFFCRFIHKLSWCKDRKWWMTYYYGNCNQYGIYATYRSFLLLVWGRLQLFQPLHYPLHGWPDGEWLNSAHNSQMKYIYQVIMRTWIP